MTAGSRGPAAPTAAVVDPFGFGERGQATRHPLPVVRAAPQRPFTAIERLAQPPARPWSARSATAGRATTATASMSVTQPSSAESVRTRAGTAVGLPGRLRRWERGCADRGLLHLGARLQRRKIQRPRAARCRGPGARIRPTKILLASVASSLKNSCSLAVFWLGLLSRHMADRLDVVPIGDEHKRSVVIRVVVRARRSQCAPVFRAFLHRRSRNRVCHRRRTRRLAFRSPER